MAGEKYTAPTESKRSRCLTAIIDIIINGAKVNGPYIRYFSLSYRPKNFMLSFCTIESIRSIVK